MKRAQDTGRAWIEIRRDALRQNVVALRTLLPPRCELMPALKANAYGHGALPVARELNCLGVRAFCVATVGEGMELRQGGVEGLILVLGYTPPEDFALLLAWDLTQAAVDCEYAKMLAHFGRGIQTHLAIDTGMHRCGERWEQMDALCEVLRSKRLRATGAFTHLCAADSADPEVVAYTLAQGARVCGCHTRAGGVRLALRKAAFAGQLWAVELSAAGRGLCPGRYRAVRPSERAERFCAPSIAACAGALAKSARCPVENAARWRARRIWPGIRRARRTHHCRAVHRLCRRFAARFVLRQGGMCCCTAGKRPSWAACVWTKRWWM